MQKFRIIYNLYLKKYLAFIFRVHLFGAKYDHIISIYIKFVII